MAIRRLESSVTGEGNISSEQRLFHLLELVTLVVEWKSGVLVGTFAKKILEVCLTKFIKKIKGCLS